ncbi:tRNA (adenosine(37)-N6)-threonylcarbamoyltransferase complex dimerization subunit type 1 TsaB [Legionella gresilensis]|uniref:tRNA (adenosine(37)-N6)-threonylcarbamoyltransferase complex dimerization subunit type 1 TsaB n=1 Tax=Legionella gresilensis TaxID=91823 RepID=UPI001041376B|nr:tRNA (adenosine(37)-N6)-threonylcarbamoyltransferase complex dimerization subunit type 1 TsaB [Legionella gresilensis]
MKLLALDTSTSVATIALLNQGEILERSQVGQGQHAQVILSIIEELLIEAALSISQLDGIVLGRGPGSFTGLRIACSIAQGLAYPHDLPIFPVSSLATLAYAIKTTEKNQDTPILVLIDARMNQVYWAYYNSSSLIDIPEYVSAANDINIIPTLPLQLVGINFMPYFSNLPEMLRASIIRQQEIPLKASTMLHLVQSEAVTPITASEALPVYIRNQVAHLPKSD